MIGQLHKKGGAAGNQLPAIRVDNLVEKQKKPKTYIHLFKIPNKRDRDISGKELNKLKTVDKTNDDIEINIQKNEVKNVENSLVDHAADIVIESPREAHQVISHILFAGLFTGRGLNPSTCLLLVY